MSSDRPSGDLSSAPEGGPEQATSEPGASPSREPGLSLASVTKARGAELLDAIERHIPGARDHADGTAAYAFATAVELGLERDHAEATREAARLHEVGNIYAPPAVLTKPPEDRSPEEQALMDSHPAHGAELARGAGIPDRVCDWIRATRERFDGRGPAGLAGERIPLEARVIRVACACDRSLADQHGSPSSGLRAGVIGRLRGLAGSELDPRVVEALAAVLGRVAPTEP
jgi:HD-GYP domain-containing protein (c-di-GMP phosphodiesterase class II)